MMEWYYWCRRNIKELPYFPKNLKRKVKNMWYWLPVIWKDENWDYGYIYDVLRHKLIRTATTIKKYNTKENADYVYDRMMLCVRLLDKIDSDKHDNYASEYHGTENDSGIFDDYIEKNKHVFKRPDYIYLDEDSPDRIFITAVSIAVYKHNKAKRLLFEILNKDIEQWWD